MRLYLKPHTVLFSQNQQTGFQQVVWLWFYTVRNVFLPPHNSSVSVPSILCHISRNFSLFLLDSTRNVVDLMITLLFSTSLSGSLLYALIKSRMLLLRLLHINNECVSPVYIYIILQSSSPFLYTDIFHHTKGQGPSVHWVKSAVKLTA